jgi:hypothetical protein
MPISIECNVAMAQIMLNLNLYPVSCCHLDRVLRLTYIIGSIKSIRHLTQAIVKFVEVFR